MAFSNISMLEDHLTRFIWSWLKYAWFSLTTLKDKHVYPSRKVLFQGGKLAYKSCAPILWRIWPAVPSAPWRGGDSEWSGPLGSSLQSPLCLAVDTVLWEGGWELQMLPRGVREGGGTGGRAGGWMGGEFWIPLLLVIIKKNTKGQDQPSTSFESVSRFKGDFPTVPGEFGKGGGNPRHPCECLQIGPQSRAPWI